MLIGTLRATKNKWFNCNVKSMFIGSSSYNVPEHKSVGFDLGRWTHTSYPIFTILLTGVRKALMDWTSLGILWSIFQLLVAKEWFNCIAKYMLLIHHTTSRNRRVLGLAWELDPYVIPNHYNFVDGGPESPPGLDYFGYIMAQPATPLQENQLSIPNIL